ncbi:hypothetical protein FRB90_004038 [Tulasnella sp. 427]|nr:hypothetical protein FRB90_004038 [Tulasnella sp. 427]
MDGHFLRRPAPILLDTIREALHHNKLFSIASGSGPTVFQILGEEGDVSLSFRCRDPAEFSDWLANQFGPELSSVTEVYLRVSYAAASTVGPHSLRRLLESLDDVERLICPSASAGIENQLADHLGTPHKTSDGWHWSWPMIKHMELYDSWRWSDLVLSMLRSRYQPANPGDGKQLLLPVPLERLRLNGVKNERPEIYREIMSLVGEGVLEEYDGRTYASPVLNMARGQGW